MSRHLSEKSCRILGVLVLLLGLTRLPRQRTAVGRARRRTRAVPSADCAGATSAPIAADDRLPRPAARATEYEYYFGATGGGLWKTTDGGTTWRPSPTGRFRSSSVGAVAVAESNPDIVYIGMGETELRGNIIQGDGVYKSIDAGKTWTHMGLDDTQAIGRIRVDKTNPDLVYVAALGQPLRRRIRSAASSDRRTAARPGRRCCSATTRPARSTWPWTRRTPTCCMPRCGRRTATVA